MIVITCRELTELATDKAEGQLGVSQRAGVSLHLAWCKRCRTYLEQMDLAVGALGALPKESIVSEARTKLIERFNSRSR